MKEAGNNDVYPPFDALRQRSRTPRAQTPVLETHVVVGCLFHDDNDPTEHDNTRAVDHRSAQWFPNAIDVDPLLLSAWPHSF